MSCSSGYTDFSSHTQQNICFYGRKSIRIVFWSINSCDSFCILEYLLFFVGFYFFIVLFYGYIYFN